MHNVITILGRRLHVSELRPSPEPDEDDPDDPDGLRGSSPDDPPMLVAL